MKLIYCAALRAMVKDKARADDALRASDLDYAVVHATHLTNGPATAP